MKLTRYLKAALLAVVGVALTAGVQTQAQTAITNTYFNGFDIGANTSDFAGSGSVASWIYWYNTPGGNTQITNDITMDASNNPSSGSLEIVSPFAGVSGTQNLFFGTFGNGGGYDTSVTANLLLYSNVSFDLHMDPATVPFTNATTTNFGGLTVGFFVPYSDEAASSVTIPLNATNGWVHFVVPIDSTQSYTATPVDGITFDYANYSGYPNANVRFWIDNVSLVGSTAPPPLPPKFAEPQIPTPGLNSIGTSKSEFQRYHLATINDTGYSFYGQDSVTYSWNITKFPTNSDWQQHIFLLNGEPGQYDQAADYNLADCIFMTVQSQGPGLPATFNFRYKTNEPGGNGMLFNGTDSANHITYPVAGSPAMPAATFTDANGPIGTWSITFAQSTNVTVTTPSGFTTNFVFDPASAALFADPMSICVGGQVNSDGFGQILVTSDFSVTGSATPLSDDFAEDTILNTNLWKNQANDTNGAVLVPPSSAFWLNWSLPDAGYSLQTTGTLPPTNWIPLSSVGEILDNGTRAALIDSSNLVAAKQGYFSLVQRMFSQLLVLLPGEVLAPGSATGKNPNFPPTPQDTVHPVTFTVYAVDSAFFPVTGVYDQIVISSSDGEALLPNQSPLTNGVGQFQILFQSGGGVTNTVTATDATDGTKTGPGNTSSGVLVN